MHTDNYRLLFGAFAGEVARAFPAAPPLLARADRHRLMAVLDGAHGALHGGLDHPAAFEAVYGAPFAEVRSVFRRLAPAPLPRGHYAALVRRLLAEPRLGRTLCQLGEVSVGRVAVALTLPPELARAPFVRRVPSVKSARACAALFDMAVKDGRGRRDLAAALLRTRKWHQARDLLEESLTPKTLIAPPWPGDDRLKPVSTVSEVVALGHEFRNCLTHRADRWARDQDTAVYVYDGSPKAVCALVLEGGRWRVSEFKGVHNKAVPPPARRDILARFADAGVAAGESMDALLCEM